MQYVGLILGYFLLNILAFVIFKNTGLTIVAIFIPMIVIGYYASSNVYGHDTEDSNDDMLDNGILNRNVAWDNAAATCIVVLLDLFMANICATVLVKSNNIYPVLFSVLFNLIPTILSYFGFSPRISQWRSIEKYREDSDAASKVFMNIMEKELSKKTQNSSEICLEDIVVNEDSKSNHDYGNFKNKPRSIQSVEKEIYIEDLASKSNNIQRRR